MKKGRLCSPLSLSSLAWRCGSGFARAVRWTSMRKFIGGLIDVLYPRKPGEPDRSTFGEKLFALVLLGSIILLGLLARP